MGNAQIDPTFFKLGLPLGASNFSGGFLWDRPRVGKKKLRISHCCAKGKMLREESFGGNYNFRAKIRLAIVGKETFWWVW